MPINYVFFSNSTSDCYKLKKNLLFKILYKLIITERNSFEMREISSKEFLFSNSFSKGFRTNLAFNGIPFISEKEINLKFMTQKRILFEFLRKFLKRK